MPVERKTTIIDLLEGFEGAGLMAHVMDVKMLKGIMNWGEKNQ